MTQEELQKMLDEIPKKNFAKLSDKRLEYIESTQNKIFNKSTKEKISLSKKGKKFSKNHLEKISNALQGRINIQSNTKGIICYSYPDMIFIKEFKSMRYACDELNLNYKCLWAVCEGKRKSTANYTFRYKD